MLLLWLFCLVALVALIIGIVALTKTGKSKRICAISSNLGEYEQQQSGVVDLATGGAIVNVYDPDSMWNGSTTITVPKKGVYRVTTRAWGNAQSVGTRVDMHQLVNGTSTSQIQQQATTALPVDTIIQATMTMVNVFEVEAGTQFTYSFIPLVGPLTMRSGFFEVAQID